MSDRLREVVRADPVTATTCLHVGDSFADHDRLREAMRWFTMPLTWGDLDVDELDYFCLVGRHRGRRRLELPEDRLDQIAVIEMEQQRARG